MREKNATSIYPATKAAQARYKRYNTYLQQGKAEKSALKKRSLGYSIVTACIAIILSESFLKNQTKVLFQYLLVHFTLQISCWITKSIDKVAEKDREDGNESAYNRLGLLLD